MAGRTIYKGHTIFEEGTGRNKHYRTQSGISTSKFRTIEGAKKAIDRYIAKYKR